MKRTAGILAALPAVLLLQSGCVTSGVGRQANEASIVVEELVRSTKSWDGACLPAYPQGLPEISIRRIRIPAGARLDTHLHPVINAGVLTRGQLTVVAADGKTLHLSAGDPIVELVNTTHYGMNEGKVPAEIIVFYAGVVGTPITVTRPQ